MIFENVSAGTAAIVVLTVWGAGTLLVQWWTDARHWK